MGGIPINSVANNNNVNVNNKEYKPLPQGQGPLLSYSNHDKPSQKVNLPEIPYTITPEMKRKAEYAKRIKYERFILEMNAINEEQIDEIRRYNDEQIEEKYQAYIKSQQTNFLREGLKKLKNKLLEIIRK